MFQVAPDVTKALESRAVKNSVSFSVLNTDAGYVPGRNDSPLCEGGTVCHRARMF
jgi:hypothetical protein